MQGEQIVIYLDVFFGINLLMDYLNLCLTAMIMKTHRKKIRIWLASVFGAIYSIIILKPLVRHAGYITFTSAVTAGVMVLIAFGYQNLAEFLKRVIFLVLTSFLFGGILNHLYYYTRAGAMINELFHGNTAKGINARRFILVTLISYSIMISAVRLLRNHQKELSLIYQVKLSYRGKSVVTMALYDTGNSLQEPIGGKMVHIAEYGIIKPLLKGDEKIYGKLLVIPFHSVGEQNGLLYGIKMDEMTVMVEGDPKVIKEPVVAVYHGCLSKTGRYSVILNGETFQELS